MAQNFRSAFRGFNRDDVVHYLEYLNNKHKTEMNQLLSERDSLRSDLEAASHQPQATVTTDEGLAAKCAELTQQLEQLRSINAQLEARCAELENKQTPVQAPVMFAAQPDQELEAYRRAERVERTAKERADQVSRQTDSLLASAAAQVDSLTEQMAQAADQFSQQLEQLQQTAANSTAALRDASATLYRLRNEKQ